MTSVFCTVEEAIQQIKKKKMLILVDDQKRENEGDLFIPAQLVTAGKINFMITYGKGLICTPITTQQAKKLKLSLMVPPEENQEYTQCSFTISVDAKHGITTGISAYDRAKTIQVLAHPQSIANDLVRPGHIFPLIAHEKGLLARSGHTEAAVELSKLSGMSPTGVICEIIRKDGKMAATDDLSKLAKTYHLKILTIEDLIIFIKKLSDS